MIKVTIYNRLFKITTNKKTYTINAPNTVTLFAQNIKDYTKMTLDTSPEDADVVPVNGTRNDVLSQLKISLANIKSYILGTLFNTSSGHDHDGTDSKQIAYANVTGTPVFETSASNIKADGTASVGSLSTIARADHVHPNDDSGWINLTLLNGWAVYTAWYGIAQYRKIGNLVMVRLVHIYSSANKTARGSVIAEMPSGYRISAAEMYIPTYVPGTGGNIALRLRQVGGYIENDTAYDANTKLSATALYIVD